MYKWGYSAAVPRWRGHRANVGAATVRVTYYDSLEHVTVPVDLIIDVGL